MQLLVNPSQRYAKMRAHTATHLLHAELVKIFPNTKQAWSLVDEDYLRFDFYADRLLDTKEIQTIELHINSIIQSALIVDIQELDKSEAELLWAKMFFEDKYGDRVRVVSIKSLWHDDTIPLLESIEFCGGTHIWNTKEIGCFVIEWQSAVASGIKRISAYVGPKVLELYHKHSQELETIANKLECKTAQIDEKLTKVISDLNLAQKNLNNIQYSSLDSLVFVSEEIQWIQYQYANLPNFISCKDASDYFRMKKIIWNIVLTDNTWWFLIRSSENKSKVLLTAKWRKGGGNDAMCMGKVS